MHRRFMPLELPQQRATACIKYLQSRSTQRKEMCCHIAGGGPSGCTRRYLRHRQAASPAGLARANQPRTLPSAYLHNRVLAACCDQPTVPPKAAAICLVFESGELSLCC